MTSILFPEKPMQAALAFVGCYALGIMAGVLSALLARRTILQGAQRGMALELPTYKLPSVQSAFIATVDRAKMFLKKAGTVILAICILLWWLGSFPVAGSESARVTEIRAQADTSSTDEKRAELVAKADQLAMIESKSQTFIGRLGRAAEPVFAPLGFDWQLSIGVLTSFAAREVFVSTMSVIVTGKEEGEDEGVLREIAQAKRTDGTPVFTTATAWSVLVFYVLAIQCLPTLAVTAREAGHWKWAALQFGWMTAVAYVSSLIVFNLMS
jgi:ferrous iron transport protein B